MTQSREAVYLRKNAKKSDITFELYRKISVHWCEAAHVV